MKKTIFFAMLFAMILCGVAFAQGEGADAGTVALGGIALTTYAGLAAAGTAGVSLLKRLALKWVKGKEAILALAIPILLGVIVKVVGWAFGDISWPDHAVALLASGVGSGLIHDKIINPAIGKDDPSLKPKE